MRSACTAHTHIGTGGTGFPATESGDEALPQVGAVRSRHLVAQGGWTLRLADGHEDEDVLVSVDADADGFGLAGVGRAVTVGFSNELRGEHTREQQLR